MGGTLLSANAQVGWLTLDARGGGQGSFYFKWVGKLVSNQRRGY